MLAVLLTRIWCGRIAPFWSFWELLLQLATSNWNRHNLEHACQGLPIYVWRDGTVVEIPPMNYGRDQSSWARNQSTKHSSFYMSLLSEVLGSTRDKVF